MRRFGFPLPPRPLAAVLAALAVIAAALPARAASLAEVIASRPELSTFSRALDASGLAPDLAAAGTVTVFAPDDAAFEALGPGVAQALLDPANHDALRSILAFHILEGAYPTARLGVAKSYPTLLGAPVTIQSAQGRTTINGARATAVDITADDGVVHVVDTVRMPDVSIVLGDEPPVPAKAHDGLLVDALKADGRFGTFLSAVETARMTGRLMDPGPFTVFAPTDAAFDTLPPGALARLFDPAQDAELRAMVARHIQDGVRPRNDQPRSMDVVDMGGRRFTMEMSAGRHVMQNGKPAVDPDIRATNGVIYAIERVAMNPSTN
ncbi:fasciclin domain-containing protein [Marinivivus vitaminiproducens]|uniref:fasciclin domain-containing protein n=1 Tax=Marinivivus vitaminiproducens TaxID=3035935 RepID=UPI0027AB7F6B|nr:fasciclin domain-containing protein [Geminicoccaceae bacterium SCSIO 64248]